MEFHVSEDDVVEAAILAGNDYTPFMHDLELRKSVNFFSDHCKEKKKRYHLTDIMDGVSGLDSFQVKSSDVEQKLWIEFSRDLYHFQDISGYIDKVKDCVCDKDDVEVGVDVRSFMGLQQNAIHMTVRNIDFEAFFEYGSLRGEER